MITWVKRHAKSLAIGLLVAISITAWAVFYSLGLTVIYNDAMSHLNVARLVVDNIQPGFAQLGSVWLPMSHILSLPLIWNDMLWHTGLAGSLISMAAFVISAVALYKLVLHLSGSRVGGIFATAAFVFSLNMLYLQSTPLTEPLYICLFILTVLFLVKYIKYRSDSALIALALVSAVGILTRYDAWFVAAVVGVIIVVNDLFFERQKLQAVIGRFVLYAFPIAFAVFLWLGWNLLIFHDPLYAFVGPYSAHAQQETIEASSGLITKYNAGMSSWAYTLSVLENVGVVLTIVGAVGWTVYLFFSRIDKARIRFFAFIAMFSIVLFNVLALFLGFSILNLPGLNWNPSGTLAGELFNVRYGILALPFIAIGTGLLIAEVSRMRYMARASMVAVALVIVGQSLYIYFTGIIAIRDGQVGSSAFVNQDIADAIRRHVKPGEYVIMSTSSYNAVAFESGLNLDQFVHEGVNSRWNGAISQPEKHGKWIVIANNDVGEPIHESLIKNQNSAFLSKYEKVFTGAYAGLYKLKG